MSVLVGPIATSTSVWAGRADQLLDVDSAAAMTSATLASACVAAACRQCGLLAGAVAELGRRLGRPVERVLVDSSGHDLEQLWRSVDHGDDDLLQLLRTVGTRPVETWAPEVGTHLPGWRGLIAIDRLIAAAPAVWLAAPVDVPIWLATIAGPVAALATAVPRWTIGVGVTAESFAGYRATAGPGRDATLLCGGAIEISTVAGGPAAEPLGSVDPDDEPDDDPARSAAERFLFELLKERWPGLFALNVALPFPFGSRAAEADLYADAVRLVIEIDGYHHFQDPVCYRRDRRKDWAYQANGYRVVRVLAEDVVPRAGEILDRIGAAVDHCRRDGATSATSGPSE